MPNPTDSFEKFNYTIRPSKQVERKLFIEAFHYLGHNADYNLKEYTYLGMGSVFYTDFVLFHKYLYLDEMICIEAANIRKRMKFNKPYDFIRLKMGRVSDVLPTIRFRDKKYIVWLDYDSTLDEEALVDIDSFVRKLKSGSFLIVTVDAEPKLRNMPAFQNLPLNEKVVLLQNHYEKCSEGLLSRHIRKSDLAKNSLPGLAVDIINARIRKSLSFRNDDAEFIQLFNYLYADGAQMLSFGGLIDSASKIASLQNSKVLTHTSIVQARNPYKITVPPLTTKEKCFLDSCIKKGVVISTIKNRLPFELEDEYLESYLSHYRHYPTYHEAIM